MGLNAIIRGQEFKNQFYNGVDFSQNPNESRGNLAGSIMEKMQVTIDIGISWFSDLQINDPGAPSVTDVFDKADYTFDGTELTIIRKSGSFLDEGFRKGDILNLYNSAQGSNLDTDVEAIVVSKEIMVIDTNITSISSTIYAIQIHGLTDLTALKYGFGIIGNYDTFTTESQVSENDQGYYASEIGEVVGGNRSTAFVDCIRLGKYRDWISGKAKVKYVETAGLDAYFEQRFQIVHEFLVPWYIEGELPNLQDNITPQNLKGDASYKYVFDGEFRTVLSNPNTGKPFQEEDTLGSVAWFGENFNGFQSNYNIVSAKYKDQSNNAADGLLVSGRTTATIEVEKINGTFDLNDEVGVYVSYLPTENQYKDTILTDLQENFIYASAFKSTLGTSFIKSISVNLVSGNLVIEFDTDFDAGQMATLSQSLNDGNGNFVIGIQTGDQSISSGSSDAVINYVLGKFDESPDIAGLINLNRFGIYPLAGDPDFVGIYTSIETWIEDGLLSEFEFSLDLSKQAQLETLEMVCLAYSPSKSKYFILDSYPIAFNSVIKNGSQEIEVNESRNYILHPDDPYLEATVSTGSKVGSNQKYSGRYAQKMPWQSWIENADVDAVFYDKNLKQNGLNLRSNRFAGEEGYGVFLGLKASVSGENAFGVAGVTDYLLLSPELIVNDYDENDSAPNVWSGTIKTINPQTNVDLEGGILDGEDTLIRAEWSSTNGNITDITGYFVAIRIEETDQPGFAITELSSVKDAKNGQLLYGEINPLRLNVYLSGGNVIAEAMVNGSDKIQGQAYNISAAIKEEATPPFAGGFDYINGFLIK